MNTLENLFLLVESVTFSSNAYAANTLSSFTAYVESTKEFNTAVSQLSSNLGSDASIIETRISKLLNIPNDENYMHIYDVAIGVYLYLLFKINIGEFNKVISNLALPKNMWWSKQMLQVLKPEFNTIQIGVQSPLQINTIQNNYTQTTVPSVSNTSNTVTLTEVL